jgi:hypothetical protein
MNNGKERASHFDLKALLFMHFGNHIRIVPVFFNLFNHPIHIHIKTFQIDNVCHCLIINDNLLYIYPNLSESV